MALSARFLALPSFGIMSLVDSEPSKPFSAAASSAALTSSVPAFRSDEGQQGVDHGAVAGFRSAQILDSVKARGEHVREVADTQFLLALQGIREAQEHGGEDRSDGAARRIRQTQSGAEHESAHGVGILLLDGAFHFLIAFAYGDAVIAVTHDGVQFAELELPGDDVVRSGEFQIFQFHRKTPLLPCVDQSGYSPLGMRVVIHFLISSSG